jgi:ArsR family transcriptional regulator, arsenate/arsenite/antimonite-responsive transcriptional repressor
MSEETEPDSSWTVTALAALAHEHRLAAYRLLVEAGPAGISAGEIAEKLGLVASSLTFHVQALLRAGLVSQRRASRHVIYAADFAAMNGLLLFLASNCCGGEIKICTPLCNPALAGQSQAAQKRKKRSG